MARYLEAYDSIDRVAVSPGDDLTDFRGRHAVFVMATRPTIPGKSGKVVVRWDDGWEQEYYDSVFNLYVKEVEK